MLIYFKRCCDHIKDRLQKQKKVAKKLQKNNCCWYIATKVVSFFSAVYMYFTTFVIIFVLESISFIFFITKRHVTLF